MKKVYLFLSAALVATAGFAQQVNMTGATEEAGQREIVKTFSVKDVAHSKSGNKVIQSNWYDYADAYSNLYTATPYGIVGNNLFPDSTVMVNYGTSGYSAPWIHSIAQHFDLDALAFKTAYPTPIDRTRTFTIDSLQTAGVYFRPNTGMIDTLVFQIVAPNSTASQMVSTSFFTGATASNLGTDTVFVNTISHPYVSAAVKGNISAPIAEYRVLMDDNFFADSTANGLHVVDIQTANDMISPQLGALMAYSNNFAVSIDFKPQGTWSQATDTLRVTQNSWFFGSYELNGQASFPTYAKDDFNTAHILPISCRYNTNANGWNDRYIPALAYMGGTNTYSYEAHAISAYITQDDFVGLEETVNEASFSVYPNPSNGEFNINLTSESSQNVSLTVRNVVGQTIINKTVAVSGLTKETISLSDYSNGIYFLTVDNNTVKLIVE